MTATAGPKNAPYQDVLVGQEIEVRVFEREDGQIVAECNYDGDIFGGALDPPGLDRLALTVEVDNLVTGICGLVWNELYGVPVFREEDDEYVGRVSAVRPWEKLDRRSTQGWIGSVANPDALRGDEPEPEPQSEPEPERSARDDMAANLGDADVADLKLTNEEMAALMRGEMPEGLPEKLLAARSTENLLDSVADALADFREDGPPDYGVVARIRRELGEVRRRYRHS